MDSMGNYTEGRQVYNVGNFSYRVCDLIDGFQQTKNINIYTKTKVILVVYINPKVDATIPQNFASLL